MSRIVLTDGSKRWFESDKAEVFKETLWWNGNNHISNSTGSQWDHESLLRTKSGIWVLNHWSQYQGSVETYKELTDKEASEWFIQNEYEDEDIPESVKKLVEKHISELEI